MVRLSGLVNSQIFHSLQNIPWKNNGDQDNYDGNGEDQSAELLRWSCSKGTKYWWPQRNFRKLPVALVAARIHLHAQTVQMCKKLFKYLYHVES